MSVVVAKLRHSFMGIFIRSKMIVNKKRPPWQEVVFNVTNNLGKLSPQGGDLVQLIFLTWIRISSLHNLHLFRGATKSPSPRLSISSLNLLPLFHRQQIDLMITAFLPLMVATSFT